MLKYINAALYNVDLEGENTSEFDGEHPTLVIRAKMEKELYIAIPFTTYKEGKMAKIEKIHVLPLHLNKLYCKN